MGLLRVDVTAFERRRRRLGDIAGMIPTESIYHHHHQKGALLGNHLDECDSVRRTVGWFDLDQCCMIEMRSSLHILGDENAETLIKLQGAYLK